MKKILKAMFFIMVLAVSSWALNEYVIKTPVLDAPLQAVLENPHIKDGKKDWDQTIGVNSADDVSFRDYGKYLTIGYGNTRFDVYKDDLDNKVLEEAMSQLKLAIKKTKEGKYYVTYDKKVVKQYI